MLHAACRRADSLVEHLAALSESAFSPRRCCRNNYYVYIMTMSFMLVCRSIVQHHAAVSHESAGEYIAVTIVARVAMLSCVCSAR